MCDPGGPMGTRYFIFFFSFTEFVGGGGRLTDGGWRLADGGWRVTDGGWPMTSRSCSSAGALRRFEWTGGRRFLFLVLRPALV